MNRLRLLFLVLLVASSCSLLYQAADDGYIYTAYSVDGYWGTWEPQPNMTVQGPRDCFILYERGTHPSDWGTRITIRDMDKTINHSDWREYNGTIEYHAVESNLPSYAEHSKEYVKRSLYYVKIGYPVYTRPAKIKVCRSGGRIILNVFFDDVALGLSFLSKD